MANEVLDRDDNRIPVVAGIGSDADADIIMLRVDPISKRLLVDTGASAAGDGAILDGTDSDIKATVFDLTNSNPLAVRAVDANGTALASFPVTGTFWQAEQPVSLTILPDTAGGDLAAMVASLDTLDSIDFMLGTDFSDVFGSASLISATPAVKVEEQGIVEVYGRHHTSTANSSTTPLGIGGVFTGTGELIAAYSVSHVAVVTDKNSATGGLQIQYSQDNTNWDVIEEHTVIGGTPEVVVSPHNGLYFRVVYTNGAQAQTYFRLQVMYHSIPIGNKLERIDGDIQDGHMAQTVKAILSAKIPAGTYTNIDATAGGNLKVAIEEVNGATDFATETTLGEINAAVELLPSKITGISHGVKTVTTAGTDVPLVASSTPCKRVIVQAQTDNTGLIAVGASGVDATIATGTGMLLNPGDAIEFEIDDLADVYIDSTVSTDGVRFTYFT